MLATASIVVCEGLRTLDVNIMVRILIRSSISVVIALATRQLNAIFIIAFWISVYDLSRVGSVGDFLQIIAVSASNT